MAASKLSQLFNRGKKQPKFRNQSSKEPDSDSDEGYQDPIQNCPTEPPTRIPVPSYPPPRPASPKGHNRSQQPVRDDYADPWDSRGGRSMSNGGGVMGKMPPPRGMDTYQDPFDSRKKDDAHDVHSTPYDNGMSSSREDYADPFDTKFSAEKAKAQQVRAESQTKGEEEEADYDEPYEQKPTLNDTYEDPWDTRRSIDLTENVNDRPKAPPPSQVVNIKSPRKDDYSDPWDTKTSTSLTNEDFDDAYADPYDDKAKKSNALNDKKKNTNNSSSSKDDDDDDLYDMPYEEKEMIGIAPKPNQHQGLANFRTPSVSKPLPKPKQEIPQRTAPKPPLPYSGNVASPTSPTSAVSSLPQVAVGGGGSDYDSPWEWKVNKVEQEFVKRFSVGGDSTKPAVAPRSGAAGGKRLGPAPPPPINNQNINPVPKPHRTNPPPPIPATLINRKEKEYQVDPTIPLDNQGWFHGHIRRGDAEILLHNQPDCSYLIRNSESSKLDYSLSLRNRGAPMHLKISNREGKYILGINSRPYDTIPEMIHHYSMHMLNIKGAEHVKLQYPVFQENMYFTVEPGS